MSVKSRIETLSNRTIQRTLNEQGTLSGAAAILKVHSQSLARAIMERKINWTPSFKSKAMLKAAQTNKNVRRHTPFKFGGDTQTLFTPKKRAPSRRGRPIGSRNKPKGIIDAAANGGSNGAVVNERGTAFVVGDLPNALFGTRDLSPAQSSNGNGNTHVITAAVPETLFKSLLREMILDGSIKIGV